jgi:hypothetical protein
MAYAMHLTKSGQWQHRLTEVGKPKIHVYETICLKLPTGYHTIVFDFTVFGKKSRKHVWKSEVKPTEARHIIRLLKPSEVKHIFKNRKFVIIIIIIIIA